MDAVVTEAGGRREARVSKSQIKPRFEENERDDVGLDGQTFLVRPTSKARTATRSRIVTIIGR